MTIEPQKAQNASSGQIVPTIADPARLDALASYDILDTPAKPGFEDVVYLACRLCAAPAALVSLVAGDRQWFKARAGFPLCQTDLNSLVCAHAFAEPDRLLVTPTSGPTRAPMPTRW